MADETAAATAKNGQDAQPAAAAKTSRLSPKKPRKWLRISLAAVPLLALAAAWAFILAEKPLDRHDPATVSGQFLAEIQANHPNRAYALTSQKYQQTISKADFTDILDSILAALPATKPVKFGQSNPPSGDKDQLQVIYNIPGDGETDDHRAAIVVVKKDGQWSVEVFTVGPGRATPENTGAKATGGQDAGR